MQHEQRSAAYYRELGDDALAEAMAAGPHAYNPRAWAVIVAEAVARGFPLFVPPMLDESSLFTQDDRAAVRLLSREELRAHLASANQQYRRGARYAVLGLAVAIGAYVTASPGRIYALALGPLVYGLLQIRQAAKLEDWATASLRRVSQWEINGRSSNDR